MEVKGVMNYEHGATYTVVLTDAEMHVQHAYYRLCDRLRADDRAKLDDMVDYTLACPDEVADKVRQSRGMKDMFSYKALTSGENATLEARTNLCSQVGDRDRDALALLARKLSSFNAGEAREFCTAVVKLGEAVDKGYGCVYLKDNGKPLAQLLTDEQAVAIKKAFEAESDAELWHLVAERIREGATPDEALTEVTMEKEAVEVARKKAAINSVYGKEAAKRVHPDEDCVLPGEERYGGNDTYLHIRRVLGHKGAFDFCMGNVVKLADRWDKKGNPVENLKKLRDYAEQALVEWRLYSEKMG